MRITIITSPFGALPPQAVGAVEKLYQLLAHEWARKGHQVCFICSGGGSDPEVDYRRLKRYDRTGSTKWDLIWDFIYSVKAIWRCPRTDVLLCNTFWSPALAPLMRWKYKKLIYGVHRFPKRQFFLYPFVHKFACVSKVVAEALKRQISAKRIHVVVNPIDTGVFKYEQRKAVEGRILYAGRIHPLKGLRALAKVCGQLFSEGHCKELLLVGPWELAKGGGGESFVRELRDLAKSCPVELVGPVMDPESLAEIERSASIFVYPSEDEHGESFGIAPLEAMALGVPTIVSSLQCFNEYVDNAVNAMTFMVGNACELKAVLLKILLDKAFSDEIGKRAACRAKQFSAKNIADAYIKLFDDIS